MFKSLLISALFVLSSQVIAATATNIAESAERVSPLLPGLTVPNIELKDQYGKTVSLTERFKEKTTVLIVIVAVGAHIVQSNWLAYKKLRKN